jgi:hypothetical protein
MVRLHVRLEDRHDRRAHGGGDVEIVVDELDVRIDNRQPSLRGAAEEVARA